jgi:hypothetical protein
VAILISQLPSHLAQLATTNQACPDLLTVQGFHEIDASTGIVNGG